MQVVPRDEGGSEVMWSAQFERPDEVSQSGQEGPPVEEMVQGIVRAGLENLRVVVSG